MNDDALQNILDSGAPQTDDALLNNFIVNLFDNPLILILNYISMILKSTCLILK